ncbi:MAG: sulfide/dihydroorotate dehydrogenase-like FAD/NAD-binding protein [bacterium]
MAYRITEKKELAADVKLMKIGAPLIARKAKPGQFIIFRIDERGERIPLTIMDTDKEDGLVSIIFQEVGKATKQLGQLQVGDEILDFVGPLGKPTKIEKVGTVVCIGGGIGVAPIYPIAKAFKKKGNRLISIIGARSKELLILEKEMGTISDQLHVTTDDGSYGYHGFVTDMLQKLKDEKETIDLVMAIGPVPMMHAVSNLTREFAIKTLVSLNPIMIDGTGMCGGCRVSIGGETKFACVDGPEFDGHLVDFHELRKRQGTFRELEHVAHTTYNEKCRLAAG